MQNQWLSYVFLAVVIGGFMIYYTFFAKKHVASIQNKQIEEDRKERKKEQKHSFSFLPVQLQGPAYELAQGRYQAFVQQLQKLRAQGQWTEFYYAISTVGDYLIRSSLDEAIVANPQESILYLLRGQQAQSWAWQARGHGSSDSVGEEDYRLFYERMALAEGNLHNASQLDSKDPTAFVSLVALAIHIREDGTEQSHAEQALSAALQRNPDDYAARRKYFNYFCVPRWGGSEAQTRSFAEAATSNVVGGDLRWAFPALVVFDQWNHLLCFESVKSGQKIVQDPNAQAQALQSYRALVGNQIQPSIAMTKELDLYAMWFFAAKDKESCRHALGHLSEEQYGDWGYCEGRVQMGQANSIERQDGGLLKMDHIKLSNI